MVEKAFKLESVKVTNFEDPYEGNIAFKLLQLGILKESSTSGPDSTYVQELRD